MFQTNEQDKPLETDLNEMEIMIYPERDSKSWLQRSGDEQSENLSDAWTKRISTKRKYKKYQTEITELKNIIELKNSMESFKGRLDQVEERIKKLKDRAVEFIQSEEEKEKK